MTKVGKLYAHLLASSKIALSFREFEQLLLAFGFVEVRQRGSHRTYDHHQCRRSLTIQPKGTDAAPYQVREFLAMVEEYRLSLDD